MSHRRLYVIQALMGLSLGLALGSGCQYWPTAPAQGKSPEFWVKFDSPASGIEVQAGDRVALQVTASSPNGVSWIELWMNGELMATVQAPTPLWPKYSAVYPLEAKDSGEHLIEALAFDGTGAASPTTSMILRVKAQEVRSLSTPTLPAIRLIPTITPLSTITPAPMATAPVAETTVVTSAPAG